MAVGKGAARGEGVSVGEGDTVGVLGTQLAKMTKAANGRMYPAFLNILLAAFLSLGGSFSSELISFPHNL